MQHMHLTPVLHPLHRLSRGAAAQSRYIMDIEDNLSNKCITVESCHKARLVLFKSRVTNHAI